MRPFFCDVIKEFGVKKETEELVRRLSRFCFGLYLLLLVYFMFFSEEWGRSILGGDYRYNLVPFREIRRYLQYYRQIGGMRALLNLAGNVIGFLPFGALLPVLKEKKTGFWKVTLLSFELSLFIEVSQLVLRAGSCDVDDVILNTLGGCMGFCLYKAAVFIKEKNEKKEKI